MGVALRKAFWQLLPSWQREHQGDVLRCYFFFFCKVSQMKSGTEDLPRQLGIGPGPVGCAQEDMKQVPCQEL